MSRTKLCPDCNGPMVDFGVYMWCDDEDCDSVHEPLIPCENGHAVYDSYDESRKLYRYNGQALFVAHPDHMEQYLNYMLRKNGIDEHSKFETITQDQELIDRLVELFNGTDLCGINPLSREEK